MPSPARSTGTSNGGMASRTPSVVRDRACRTSNVSISGVAHGLVHEHVGQPSQADAECGIVAARIAHRGQEDRCERVVDDVRVHVSKNKGARGEISQESNSRRIGGGTESGLTGGGRRPIW